MGAVLRKASGDHQGERDPKHVSSQATRTPVCHASRCPGFVRVPVRQLHPSAEVSTYLARYTACCHHTRRSHCSALCQLHSWPHASVLESIQQIHDHRTGIPVCRITAWRHVPPRQVCSSSHQHDIPLAVRLHAARKRGSWHFLGHFLRVRRDRRIL